MDSEVVCHDGTNVAVDIKYVSEPKTRLLPWYDPSKSLSPPNWQKPWEKLRERFDRLIDERLAVECCLTQTRIPAYGHDHSNTPPGFFVQRAIWAENGMRREPLRLFDRHGSPLRGAFPIISALGSPIVDGTGNNVAFAYGFTRYQIIQPTSSWDGDFKKLPVPTLKELCSDGAHLLYQLPSTIAVDLWRNWPGGFSKQQNNGSSLWLDFLSELSWRGAPGSHLHSVRYSWEKNFSVGLRGGGLFPRMPKPSSLAKPELEQPNKNEGNNPLAYYSRLQDVARASIVAIDYILSFNSERSPEFNRKPVMQRDRVFISYSHKDKKFLDELLAHLKPLERSGT